MSGSPPDQAPGAPHPREVSRLIGRAAQETAFRQALQSGRTPHAWLLEGPQGVGKATFAYAAARAILDPEGLSPTGLAIDPARPAARMAAARSHPDLFVVARAWDDQRKRYKTEIAADDMRAACQKLQRTASISPGRVLIVDAVDDCRRTASDALLKTLEEPPDGAVLFLIAHRPGAAPATLRSRCRRMTFSPLSADETAAVLHDVAGWPLDDAKAAAATAEGAPGRALAMETGGDAVRLVEAALDPARALDDVRLDAAAHRLASAVTGRDAATLWLSACEAMLKKVALDARAAAAGPKARPLRAARLARLQGELRAHFDAVERLNLDKRGAMLEAAWRIRDAWAETAPR